MCKHRNATAKGNRVYGKQTKAKENLYRRIGFQNVDRLERLFCRQNPYDQGADREQCQGHAVYPAAPLRQDAQSVYDPALLWR